MKIDEYRYQCPKCLFDYKSTSPWGVCPNCGAGFKAERLQGPGLKRGKVLLEALEVINGERQDQYGNPEDSFSLIAGFWDAFVYHKLIKLGVDLSVLDEPIINKRDSVLMMSLFKHGREMYQAKRDNLVDASGYLGIAGDMPAGRPEEES